MSEVPRGGSVNWQDRATLSGADLADFLALRLVCGNQDSSVYRVGEHFVENQRPVLPFLADSLTTLVDVGHLTLGDSSRTGLRPVVITASGRVRYEDLCDCQGVPPYSSVVIERPGGMSMENSTMDEGARWVFDSADGFAHVLAGITASEAGMLVTRCGRELPAEHTLAYSVPPSLTVCPICGPRGRVDRHPAVFPTPMHY